MIYLYLSKERRISMKKMKVALLAIVALLLVIAIPAQAQTTLGFYNITGNNAGDAAIGEAQLFVDVEDAGGGQVLFTFRNTGPEDSSITDVYFDDDNTLFDSIASIDGSGIGVDFSEGATPSNLPGGNPFGFSADFSADSNPPTQPNGVNPGEWLEILFNLQSGQTFDDVLDALSSGALRIGIHVQGFASGGSESFINEPPEEEPPEVGTITIIKDASPADGTDFNFTATLDGGAPVPFQLDDAFPDDGDSVPGSATHQEEGSWSASVTEVDIPSGWELDNIYCSGTGEATINEDEATVTIAVDAGETMECVFHNVKPTAIILSSFTAEAGAEGVTLAWETGTEVDNAGFNLYRALLRDGPYTKINDALITAQGDPVSGASYSFLDTPGYGTFYYQLEDMDLYGMSTLHGPVKVTVARPLRRPLYRPGLPEF
jgi:hypothetical protein